MANVTFLLLLLSLLSMITRIGVNADDKRPTIHFLHPDTLSDQLGNTADEESNIKFAIIKDKYNYNPLGEMPGSIAMAAWFYDMSTDFARTSLSGRFPSELVKKIMKSGKSDLDPKKIAKDFAGYLIALVIGIALLVITPFIGFCFCCCRCIGLCGGRRDFSNPRDAGYEDHCGRRTTFLLFTACLGIAITGTFLMMLTNHNLNTHLNNIKHAGLKRIDNVPKFLSNTINQIHLAINGKINFTAEVASRDLRNIGFLIGQRVVDEVSANYILNGIYAEILKIEKDARKLNGLLIDFNKLQEEYRKKTKSIAQRYETDPLKTSLDQALASKSFAEGVQYSGNMTVWRNIKLKDKTGASPDFQNYYTFIEARSKIEESKGEIYDVPIKIKDETFTGTKGLKDGVYENTYFAESIFRTFNFLEKKFLKEYKSINPRKYVEKGLEIASEYDNLRWYGGRGLAILALLTSTLLLLAVIFGFCGGSASVRPNERSKLSDRAGCLLLAGSIFALFTAWFLILVTLPVFLVAAPAETFGCFTIRNPDILDELIGDVFHETFKGNGSWAGNVLFPSQGRNWTFSKFFDVCSSGGTLLKAFSFDVFDLDVLLQFYKNAPYGLGLALSNFKVNFTGTALKNIYLKPFFSTVTHIANLEDEYHKKMAENPMDLTADFKQYLKKRSMDSKDARQKEMADLLKDLNKFEPTAKTIDAGPAKTLSNMKRILQSSRAITNPSSGKSLTDRCEQMSLTLDKASEEIPTLLQDAYIKARKQFANRMKRILNQTAVGLIKTIKTEIGVCKPVYDTYDDLLVKLACDYIIGSFNAWACSMGMTAVSMLLMVCISSSLSKHLYIMNIASEHAQKSNKSNQNIKKRIVSGYKDMVSFSKKGHVKSGTLRQTALAVLASSLHKGIEGTPVDSKTTINDTQSAAAVGTVTPNSFQSDKQSSPSTGTTMTQGSSDKSIVLYISSFYSRRKSSTV